MTEPGITEPGRVVTATESPWKSFQSYFCAQTGHVNWREDRRLPHLIKWECGIEYIIEMTALKALKSQKEVNTVLCKLILRASWTCQSCSALTRSLPLLQCMYEPLHHSSRGVLIPAKHRTSLPRQSVRWSNIPSSHSDCSMEGSTSNNRLGEHTQRFIAHLKRPKSPEDQYS